jgi:hypothetical protein
MDSVSAEGIMVFFNDPVPIPDPAERAVKMAMAMREAAGMLIVDWRERGRDLGFGAGIAQGYATLGQIGFSERSGYTAIGTVCNVAARLCAEAKATQSWFLAKVAVALSPVVILTTADVIGWLMRTLRRHTAKAPQSGTVTGTEPAGSCCPTGWADQGADRGGGNGLRRKQVSGPDQSGHARGVRLRTLMPQCGVTEPAHRREHSGHLVKCSASLLR